MPTARVNNPAADRSRPVFPTRRDPRTGFRRVGSPIGSTDVVQGTLDIRYKKQQLARRRKASRGRAALAIRLDSEKPIPRF